MTATANRNQKLDLRVTAQAKSYLKAAAQAAHQSVSEFVLKSALARAEETLAERRSFALDEDKWARFVEALDGPSRDMPAVGALFERDSPFERP